MDKKRIGVLEFCGTDSRSIFGYAEGFMVQKQFAGIGPQAVSAWCRKLGHEVFYALYFGFGDPGKKLPQDLDIVFISAYTFQVPLAYALGKMYRAKGIRTVIGGPHADSFPQDCLRYFDLVVMEIDQALIADIVNDQFEPGSIVSSPKGSFESPTIEERLPEIKIASFFGGKPQPYSFIPLVSSVGCPYSCDFCVDWDSKFRLLSLDRLEEDLRFVSKNFPQVKLAYHDPNFGIRFDDTMPVLESLPKEKRNGYGMESSINLLNLNRLERMLDTKCLFILCGVESWNEFSVKAGVGGASSTEKMEKVIEQFELLKDYVPYIQTTFILGLDTDMGDEPFEITAEFVRRMPFAWPAINVPLLWGGTPMTFTLLKEDRILRAMPFSFYKMPYLAITLKNYDPLIFYQKLLGIYQDLSSKKRSRERVRSNSNFSIKFGHLARNYTQNILTRIPDLLRIIHQLETNPQFHAFHTGQSDVLPEFYAQIYRQRLGKYAELMPVEESRPIMSSEPADPLISSSIPVTVDEIIPQPEGVRAD